MQYDEPGASSADLRTALLAGVGLGLSVVGIFVVPIMAPVALALSYLGWRSARPSYRVGRAFALVGMVLGLIGLAALIVRVVITG